MLAVVYAAAIAFTGAVASSTAGVPAGSTGIVFLDVGFDENNGFVVAYGRIAAQPQKCAKHRGVRLDFVTGSESKVVDTARSSDRAYFAVAGPTSDQFDSIRVVVPKSKVRFKGSKLTCERAQRELQE